MIVSIILLLFIVDFFRLVCQRLRLLLVNACHVVAIIVIIVLVHTNCPNHTTVRVVRIRHQIPQIRIENRRILNQLEVIIYSTQQNCVL